MTEVEYPQTEAVWIPPDPSLAREPAATHPSCRRDAVLIYERLITIPSPELRHGVRLAVMSATDPCQRAAIIEQLVQEMTDQVAGWKVPVARPRSRASGRSMRQQRTCETNAGNRTPRGGPFGSGPCSSRSAVTAFQA